MIKDKAAKFLAALYPGATMEFSNGWLEKFKKRHCIRSFREHGESGSANQQAIEETLPELRKLLDGYPLKDIYNMDETGLFYMLSGDTGLATKQLEGKKKMKQRLSIAICCNGDGTDKLPLLVVGKSANPRCFKGVDKDNLGVSYSSNSKAWMTSTLFQDWLRGFDQKMHGRSVLLLMDNCPAHKLDRVELRNTKVHFLPPNTTSKIQPCDAGIIRTFKAHYRKRYINSVLEGYEQGDPEPEKIDVLKAIFMCRAAWHLDVKPETIAHCFQHCDIRSRDKDGPNVQVIEQTGTSQIQEAVAEPSSGIRQMSYRNPMDINQFIHHEEESDVAEDPTEESIIDNWRTDIADTGEENAEPWPVRPAITHAELQRMVLQIEDYVTHHGCDLKILQAVDSLKRFARRPQPQKQMTLTNFFSTVNVLSDIV